MTARGKAAADAEPAEEEGAAGGSSGEGEMNEMRLRVEPPELS